MAWVSLGIFLGLVAIAWVAALTWMMASQLLTPSRMHDGKALAIVRRLSPADLGLAFSAMGFSVRDSARPGPTLRLAAWWIPAAVPSDRTALLLHGYGDAKVGGIAWAPTWHTLGWNVLAIDLRAHGESEGVHSTAGFFERDDIDQVINALRLEKPNAARHLAIFGVSLGAAVACAVGARREDLAAIVLESPFADYLSAVHTHGRRMAMPVEAAHAWAYRLAERLSGARFDDVRPVVLIPELRTPLMLIHSGEDGFVAPTDRARLDAALTQRPPSVVTHRHEIAGAEHTLGLLSDPQAYQQALSRFLDQAMASSSPAPARAETR